MSHADTSKIADQVYIKKFNDSFRQEARIISIALLFALLVFTLWDFQFLSMNHPAIYTILLTRFLITLPFFIYIFIHSYHIRPVPRLDVLISIGFALIFASTVFIHGIYYHNGLTLPIDSILLCSIVIYFVPNIFSLQKIFLGSFIFITYFIFLIYSEQSTTSFIRAGIYLSLLNLGGIIHSISFDRHRRANFEKTAFLKEMARTDQLTGAQNRHKFDEDFQDLLEQGKLENKGVAIAIVDIDFFKQYNDFYGHFAGDECLIKVAQIFLTMRRHPLDSCIRFGGEEFILIKYGVNFEQSVNWGQKIINTTYGLNIEHKASSIDQRLTVSAGVIHWHPHSPLERTQLMKLADDALYKAKQNGRNQVHVHLSKDKTVQ